MEIVRYLDRVDGEVRVGVRRDREVSPLSVATLADLWARPLPELRALVNSAQDREVAVDEVVLLPPVDGRTEVWAAGVTYARSKSAREEESSVAEVYALVYQAERPELFFKSVGWRVVTDGEPVSIREDSALNVPEAELAVVANAQGEIVGYTVCNDMSSRSIEGENPLYLPQAKIYAGSCALASGIRPAWELADVLDLGIELTVQRAGETAFAGRSSTASLYRTPADLVGWLYREQSFPAGVILSTGTGIVPEMAFSLRAGDVVSISIDQVGSLANRVVVGKGGFDWLSGPDRDRPGRATLDGAGPGQ